MFGVTTNEEIPKAYLTSHDAWDRFIGVVWHGLFPLIQFRSRSIVAELGPGTSLKIGHALASASFEGELYLVDSSARVLDILKPKYEALLPNAKITCVHSAIQDCRHKLPDEIEFILASHIIDDLIIHEGKDAACEAWAEAYTFTPADILKQAWDRMREDEPALAAVGASVRQAISTLIQDLNPKGVILNQYPSAVLYDHGMDSLNDCAYAVFDAVKHSFGDAQVDAAAVKDALGIHKNYGNRHIGEYVLNPKYWMLLCR